MPEKTFGSPFPAGPVSIGIDQSLTGFAVTALNTDDPTNYITWVYKSPQRGVQRLADIRFWFTDKLQTLIANGNQIVDIAMEGTVLASHSALVLGELSAVVKLALWDIFEDSTMENCRTPLQIPPMTLKKYAAGKGNAKKQEMLMQIYKRYNVEFNDDNAADSYALARVAAKLQINAVEKEILEKIENDNKYRGL